MNLNVSMLRDYLKCPQLAYNAHVLRRGAAKKPVALDVGSLFHEAMMLRPEKTVLSAELPSWLEVSEDAREQWVKHKLWLPANSWKPDEGEETIGAEIVLEAPFGEHKLQGRLDRLVGWSGKFWHRQWKTYTDGLLDLQERVRLSWHEVAYQYLAETNGYKPWGGTILGACQKLPGYRMIEGHRHDITDTDRIDALTFHYLFRALRAQQRMLDDLKWHLKETAYYMRVCIPPPRNYDSCFGPFGRGRCQYFSVCHEGGSLNDPQFVTLEDRYNGGRGAE